MALSEIFPRIRAVRLGSLPRARRGGPPYPARKPIRFTIADIRRTQKSVCPLLPGGRRDSLLIGHFLMVFASNRIHVAEAVTDSSTATPAVSMVYERYAPLKLAVCDCFADKTSSEVCVGALRWHAAWPG